MVNIQFSKDLFKQIGGTNWITRPGKFEKEPLKTISIELEDGSLLKESEQVTTETANAPQKQPADVVDSVSNESTVEIEDLNFVSKDIAPVLPIVVIGAGLESVWQNEESLAWQLWQNIMKAFEWDEAQVVFFDTELIVTEDAIFSTMEEVIELGVEWVLSMDEEHEISEQLSEGVQVISVPEFELMLSDPHAKQSFYHSIISIKQYP